MKSGPFDSTEIFTEYADFLKLYDIKWWPLDPLIRDIGRPGMKNARNWLLEMRRMMGMPGLTDIGKPENLLRLESVLTRLGRPGQQEALEVLLRNTEDWRGVLQAFLNGEILP